MIGCAWLGIPALSWIYVIDLSQYKGTLLIIVLGGCFCTFSYVFDNALVVIRKQNLLVCAYVIAWLYTKTTAHHMVEKWAMAGAAQRWLMQQQC
jgi:O-antigen/teichoic acid export membrane protein